MAQIEPTYVPAYRHEDLRFKLMQGSFADKPHDVYVVYDEAMDQIIVRLVEPSVLTSEYYVGDDIALLVREENQEVAGYTIVNFQSEFLAQTPQLNERWTQSRLAENLKEYRKLRYEPEAKKIKGSIQRDEQHIVTYSAFRSKAAAALAAA
jgi:hypothetical protein